VIGIGFGTNDEFTSRLARWATGSAWSHVWIEYPSKVWGGQWVAHSTPRGIVKMPLAGVLRDYPVHVRFNCNHDVSKGFEWAREYIGSPYDYGVIWNSLLYVVYRASHMKCLYNVVSRNASKYTCSEFVTEFLKVSGVNSILQFDPELTSPGMLYDTCVASYVFEFA